MIKGKLKTNVWYHDLTNEEQEANISFGSSVEGGGSEGDQCWVIRAEEVNEGHQGYWYCLVAVEEPTELVVADEGFFLTDDQLTEVVDLS